MKQMQEQCSAGLQGGSHELRHGGIRKKLSSALEPLVYLREEG
eukprot:IDg15067t1